MLYLTKCLKHRTTLPLTHKTKDRGLSNRAIIPYRAKNEGFSDLPTILAQPEESHLAGVCPRMASQEAQQWAAPCGGRVLAIFSEVGRSERPCPLPPVDTSLSFECLG